MQDNSSGIDFRSAALPDPANQRRHLQATKELIRSVISSESKQAFLDHVVRIIQEESGCKFIGIRVLDEQGYIPYQSYVGFSREFWESENMIQITQEDCSCTRIISGQLLPLDMPIVNKAGSICANDTAEFAETLSAEEQKLYRGACNNAGYRSVAVIPISYSHTILGVIHLADMRPNQFSPMLMEFVESIAPLIGEVLMREKMEQHLQLTEDNRAILHSIVTGISNLAYVVDLDTYELIYTNKKLEQLYDNSLDKKACYELFGQISPCPECPARRDNKAEVICDAWERYDAVHDKYYAAESKVINWPDGRRVHAAFVVDVTQQRKAEQAEEGLKEKLRMFQLFFMHSHEIMLFIDRTDGKIIEANPTAELTYGYTRQELLSKDIFDLRADRYSASVMQQMNMAAKDGITFETMHRRKDGTLFPVEVSSKGERIGAREILFSVVRDITERKAAQAALQQLNVDLESKVQDRTQTLQDINATLEEEIADRQAAQEALRELNTDLEDKILKRTQDLEYMNATLEEEIMERQAANDALQESKERYQVLLQQSAEAIAVIEFDTKCIVEINDAFTRMFGYSAAEVENVSSSDLGLIHPDEIQWIDRMLLASRSWSNKVRRYRRKDAQLVYAEQAGALIRYRGENLILLSYRDITEQQKLQVQIQEQVELAGVVQKSLLAPDSQNEKLVIRTVFQPLTLVSGDFYDYHWSPDGESLHGYIIDVTGHGVAAALHTTAISTLLHEVMNNEQAWTTEALGWLNNYLISYLQDNTFVALMAFTLDFERKQLTCLSGGINYVLVSTQDQAGAMSIAGSYLGVTATPEFETVTIPFQAGDAFYFMTDGIYERLSRNIFDNVGNFEETCEALQQLAQGKIHDDCSAVCIKIKASKPYPLFFNLSNVMERKCVRNRINHVLSEITGDKYSKVEVALGEAMVNAFKSHCAVQVKINKIGKRLILRVKDGGPGFAGNALVAELAAVGIEQVFENLLCKESGRGIPIMMTWTDKVLYNKQGNEVMLVNSL